MSARAARANDDVVLVKLGGSLLTDKQRPETLRRELLERLASEVAEAARRRRLVVGHGSGSFGHVAAERCGLNAGPLAAERIGGLSETQIQAARLHAEVVAALARHGAKPFSVAPSSAMVADRGRIVAANLEPLRQALHLGLLPVIFGDVVTDRSWGGSICSTESAFLVVARELRRRGVEVGRAVWMGETAGVYTPQGETLPHLTPRAARRLLSGLSGASGTDVTGGIRHRLETALRLARLGIESWIVDGRVPGTLAAALRAGPGRRVEVGGATRIGG